MDILLYILLGIAYVLLDEYVVRPLLASHRFNRGRKLRAQLQWAGQVTGDETPDEMHAIAEKHSPYRVFRWRTRCMVRHQYIQWRAGFFEAPNGDES